MRPLISFSTYFCLFLYIFLHGFCFAIKTLLHSLLYCLHSFLVTTKQSIMCISFFLLTTEYDLSNISLSLRSQSGYREPNMLSYVFPPEDNPL